MTINQKGWFPIWNTDIWWYTNFLYWHSSLFLVALLLCLWSEEGNKNAINFVGAMNASAIVALGGVQVLVLGGCTWLAIIFVNVMVFVAPTA
jgi:hypothetical protein